ncbi:hypothetical protein [Pseudooceanicola sp.]|uniref:hypothetical protein n=1 Tax=Pseudooceanicola sp. TaxID=1914328 RepID=UPI003518339E
MERNVTRGGTTYTQNTANIGKRQEAPIPVVAAAPVIYAVPPLRRADQEKRPRQVGVVTVLTD